MLIALVPLVAAVVAALVFAFAKSNPDLKELARLAFATSWLALMLAAIGKAVRVL